MIDSKTKAGHAARQAKALAHPLRVEILEAFDSSEQISPIGFSRKHGDPQGNVNYHMKILLGAGAVEVIKEVPRRGAVEHVYGLTSEGVALRHWLRASGGAG